MKAKVYFTREITPEKSLRLMRNWELNFQEKLL